MGNKRGIMAAITLLFCLSCTSKVQAAGEGKGTFASESSYYKTNASTIAGGELSSFVKAAPRIQYSDYIRNTYNVKNQGTLGTCWAFSLTSAAEINLNKKGITNGFLDLSESHLSYFFFHRMQDKWGRTKGDSVSYIGSDKTGYLSLGNNIDYAIKALANGVGYASENEGRYENIMTSYKTYSALSSKEKIDTQMKDAVRLNNVEMVNPTNRSLVKKKLAQYGAASVSFYSGDEVYSAKKSCYYNEYDNGTDHAVTLIGYDDSFSKNNFKTKPKNDGAWLMLNSWGKEFGQSGYIWISYEDATLTDFAFLDVSLAKTDETIYQYDGSSYTGEYYEGMKNPGTANVYTSGSGAEVLEEVSFYTLTDDVKVKLDVYTGYRSGTSKGTLVASKTITKSSAGYHTERMPNSVYLDPNTKFAVVVTYLGSGNWIPIDMSYTEYMNNKTGIKFVATCNKGESYSIDSSGKWTESTENFRIKAFTKKAYVGSKTTIRYYDGNRLVNISQVYKNGARYAPRSYSKPGYGLEGWYMDKQCKKKVSTVTLNTDNITLYAKMQVAIGTVPSLKIDKVTGNTIKLSWAKAKEAVQYEIYQYDETKKAYVLVSTTKNTSITIKKLSKNKTYSFRVCGKNGTARGVKTTFKASTTIATPIVSVNKKGNIRTAVIAKNTNVGFAELYIKRGNGKYHLEKTIKMKSGKAVTTNISLKKNSNYKVKVRTYTILNGKKQYSPYSKELTLSKSTRLTIQGK